MTLRDEVAQMVMIPFTGRPLNTRSREFRKIADLIRNFGPLGIPVGMAFLGFLLRVVYAALIEDQPRSIWRVTAYIVILSNVSYESFYGSIVQTVLRAAVILAVTLVGVNLVVRRGSAAAKLEVKT